MSTSTTTATTCTDTTNAATKSITTITPTEITLTCSDGMKMAAQSWKSSELTQDNDHQSIAKILCLHGWMDNCRSMHYLAPYIVENLHAFADNKGSKPSVGAGTVHIVALDFPGHGWSDHRPVDGPGVVLSELTYYVAEAIRELSWDGQEVSSSNDDTKSSGTKDARMSGTTSEARDGCGFTIIGHSMGAAVGCLYAAAFPEQVQRLVLLEGQGPLARPVTDVAKHLRAHVTRRIQQQVEHNGALATPRVYPSLEMAVKTRCQTARTFPGNQWLSEVASREMVLRGSRPVAVAKSGTPNNAAGEEKREGLQFRHDPRLLWPSVQYFTQEQNEALYQDISCSTALIQASDGWPFEKEKKQRLLELLSKKPMLVERLPGSHHFHADPETAPLVAETVVRYLQMPLSTKTN